MQKCAYVSKYVLLALFGGIFAKYIVPTFHLGDRDISFALETNGTASVCAITHFYI